MPFQKGDFITIEYVARVKDTNEVFDTTIEAEARKFNIYSSDVIYEPMLVVLGEGWVISGLEEKLYEMNVGEKREIEIPPEKGFGVRDPSKLKLVPLRMFKGESNLQPGARVRFRNALATVRSISSGRVQLDFNHPLAGKTLLYEVEVKSEVKDSIDRIKALLHRRLPTIPIEKFSLSLNSNVLVINMPSESYMIDGIQVIKRGIANDILKFIPEFSKIVFTEEYTRRVEAKTESKEAKEPS
ncbi:MAG: FKBP-type peptidyl-prolyl cis-trans isomerase [Candidatus Bathyarchaeia archaeon]